MKATTAFCRGSFMSTLISLHAFPRLLAAIDAPLKTQWTDDVNANPSPWSEYPRPQMARQDWQSLNGQWDYFGGDSQVNPTDGPSSPPDFPSSPEQIKVPFPPESYLSGIMRDLEINMWYRRNFTVPESWASGRLLLHFEAVAESASVYINGQLVGQHAGRWETFTFDITDLLVSGDNIIIIGANDPHDGKTSCGKGVIGLGDYTFTSGIWQTVWLEPVPGSHLDQVVITTSLEDSSVSVTAITNGADTTVNVQVSADGQVVNTGTGQNGSEIVVPVSSPHKWSPDDPYLYDLQVQLLDRSGTVVDQVTSYFGMRSIALGDAGGSLHPLLNGKFVFQLGPLDQGYWPDGIHTPPSDVAIQYDLQALKDLGFNMVRKHAKVESQRWYYWADKLGLLVWQDMPSVWYPDNDTTVQQQFEQEWRTIIQQHSNSPAIIQWVPFNENWGAYDVARITDWTKSLDPTRLVDGNSGYNNAPGYRQPPGDPGNGDFDDLHVYIGPDGAPKPSDTRAAALGEFGGVGLEVDGHMWPGDHTAYEMQNSTDALTERFIGVQGALKTLINNDGLGAAVYTQLSDVEHEVNGVLTYDRKVRKVDFDRVRTAITDAINTTPKVS